MQEAAKRYLRAGLCVLPAIRGQKRPALRSWKEYQTRLPTEAEVDAWFAGGHDGLCVLTGTPSGNLELIDFDHGGEFFEPWSQKVQTAAPGILDRLVVETSQSGGWHVVYRCRAEVVGSMKLAQRMGDDNKVHTLIETRGDGGLFLCAPTPGYELIQGDLANPPVLTETERETLQQAAWELNEYWPELARVRPRWASGPFPTWRQVRPGDDTTTGRSGRPARQTRVAFPGARGMEMGIGLGQEELWHVGDEKDARYYVFSSTCALRTEPGLFTVCGLCTA